MLLDFDKKNNSFVIKNINYEMIELIINGLNCERKNIVDRLSLLTTYLYKNYPEQQKEEFKVQIKYLKEKNEQLTLLIDSMKLYVMNIPI